MPSYFVYYICLVKTYTIILTHALLLRVRSNILFAQHFAHRDLGSPLVFFRRNETVTVPSSGSCLAPGQELRTHRLHVCQVKDLIEFPGGGNSTTQLLFPCSGPVFCLVPWGWIQWKRGKKGYTAGRAGMGSGSPRACTMAGFREAAFDYRGIALLCISFLSDSCQVI